MNMAVYENMGLTKEVFRLGIALLSVYELTKEESIFNKIQCIRKKIDELPRTEDGILNIMDLSEQQTDCAAMYDVLPFYMAYETKYDNKAQYHDIVCQFSKIESLLESGAELEMCDLAMLSMTLADTIEVTSREIYEHYSYLVGLLKKAVKILVKKINETKYETFNPASLIMTAYAIMKASRLGIISEEKYERIGRTIFEDNIEGFLTDAGSVEFFDKTLEQYRFMK